MEAPKRTAGSLHAGLVLADNAFEVAATRHLQSRLGILYGVMAGAALAFYVIDQILALAAGEWTLDHVTKGGALANLGIAVLASVIFMRLRARPVSYKALRVLDAAVLYFGAAACLVYYGVEFQEGPRDVVAILAVFVIARAIVIPSTPLTTLVFSLPIPIALFVIDRAYGTAYTYEREPMKSWDDVVSVWIWNQLVLLFGIAVATVASYLNAALRARLVEARRLGQYQLEEKIGEGGVGEVYLATHAMLKRPTAVKLLRPEIMGEEALARFDREVRVAARLTHPNTIRIFDYGRTPEGVFYYAMEHVRGHDLSRIVKRDGPLPPERVVHVLQQVCGSLTEAHGMGLVHRDVKPGNIMLCVKGGEHDVVKLVDFGLVKDLHDAQSISESPGTVCGTPETISPETLRGADASPACDLYALGAVGIFLLTGKPVFEASSTIALLRAHLEVDPTPPSERGFSIPADLERLLLRCLSKDPATRPGSAAEVGAGLRTCEVDAQWTSKAAAAWWARFEEDRSVKEGVSC